MVYFTLTLDGCSSAGLQLRMNVTHQNVMEESDSDAEVWPMGPTPTQGILLGDPLSGGLLWPATMHRSGSFLCRLRSETGPLLSFHSPRSFLLEWAKTMGVLTTEKEVSPWVTVSHYSSRLART